MIRILQTLLFILWTFGLFQILFPTLLADNLLAPLLAFAAICAIPQANRSVKILISVLATVTIILAQIYDQWGAIETGLKRATIFPAFLATILLLRATADQRREITAARDLFTSLEREKRDSGLVVGGFLIGSVLQVSVFAIIAPILGSNASESERREVFVAAMRGMALVPLWSPFVVGMAIASQYLPKVPLWQIVSLGLGLSSCCIVLSIICFDRKGGLNSLWLSLMTLAPIAPPIVIAALLVIGTSIGTGFSTIQSLIIALPIPCLIAVALSSRGSIPIALKTTVQRLPRIGPETAILVFATILGSVFEKALPDMGLLYWLQGMQLSSIAIIFLLILAMIAAGLMAVHSIVSGTILLVIFTSIPTGLADLIIMQAILVGWGLCTAVSISSLSIVTGASMFEVPMTRLITWSNFIYVFVGGIFCAMVLTAINPLLMAY